MYLFSKTSMALNFSLSFNLTSANLYLSLINDYSDLLSIRTTNTKTKQKYSVDQFSFLTNGFITLMLPSFHLTEFSIKVFNFGSFFIWWSFTGVSYLRHLCMSYPLMIGPSCFEGSPNIIYMTIWVNVLILRASTWCLRVFVFDCI